MPEKGKGVKRGGEWGSINTNKANTYIDLYRLLPHAKFCSKDFVWINSALNSDPIIIPTGGSDSKESANLPAMWETQVQFLGEKDPLEKGTATHSSILAWRIPWTEEPSGLQSMMERLLLLLWRKDFANGLFFWDCAIIIITAIIIPFPLCTQTHNIIKHFSTFSLPSVSFSCSFHWPSNSPSPTFQVFWDSRSPAQTGHLILGKLFQ